MKLLVFATLVSVSLAGRLDSNYLPPASASQINNALASNHRPSGPTPPPPAIVRLNNDNKGDGSYRFDFETENRITQQEVGEVRNAGTAQEINVIQGSYSYTGPDGIVYTVNYIADENGFRATGDHIPTAAPIPAEILEAVQQNQADEAAGIVDDGQYRPAEHEDPEQSGQQQQQRYQYNTQQRRNQQGYKY